MEGYDLGFELGSFERRTEDGNASRFDGVWFETYDAPSYRTLIDAAEALAEGRDGGANGQLVDTLAYLRDAGVRVRACLPYDLYKEGLFDELFDATRRAGVRLDIWPVLNFEHGIWVNSSNVDVYVGYVKELEARYGGTLREMGSAVMVDIEPGESLTGHVLQQLAMAVSPARRAEHEREVREAGEKLTRLADDLRSRGIASIAILPERESGFLERFGAPVPDLGHYDGIEVMSYMSMTPRPFMTPELAGEVLSDHVRDLYEAYPGKHIGASLGITEPGYGHRSWVERLDLYYHTPEGLAAMRDQREHVEAAARKARERLGDGRQFNVSLFQLVDLRRDWAEGFDVREYRGPEEAGSPAWRNALARWFARLVGRGTPQFGGPSEG